MKNPATHLPSRDEFNEFTRVLYNDLHAGCVPIVRLRGGRLVELYWFDTDGPDYEMLASSTAGAGYRWNHDGTSITSADFDIMERVA